MTEEPSGIVHRSSEQAMEQAIVSRSRRPHGEIHRRPQTNRPPVGDYD